MKLIDIGADAARELVAAITACIPPGDSLGRLVVITPDRLLTDIDGLPALWSLEGATVTRQLELDAGHYEVTRWESGKEIARHFLDADRQ